MVGNLSNDNEDGLNRLEGSVKIAGGLEIRKKKSNDDAIFKHPGVSRFGLDVRVRMHREDSAKKRRIERESPGGLSDSTRRHIERQKFFIHPFLRNNLLYTKIPSSFFFLFLNLFFKFNLWEFTNY